MIKELHHVNKVYGGHRLVRYVTVIDPIPPNTIRVRTSDGNTPIKGDYASYETATLVQGTTDIYDVYKSGTNFIYLLQGSTNVVEIIAANTSNVTNMDSMFDGCTSLTTVPLFDTSNVTNMQYMFCGCSSLTSVPLFDTSSVAYMYSMFKDCESLTSVPLFNTSSVINMSLMFYNCLNVESGALALYQQASTQATPPSYHTRTFRNCGSNTETGAAELSQIPSGWK